MSITVQIPTEAVEQIARRVFEEMSARQPNEQSEAERVIDAILAKPYWSIRETATVFGCSENHIRNLIQRSVDQSTPHPIPYCDLDGLIVFERDAVLAWAHESKPLKVRQRKSGGKKKQFPRAVNS